MLSDYTFDAPSRYPLMASVYLERNDPERHAGLWLRWIYASWSRQQLDMAFWDYIESISRNETEFRKIVEFETGMTDLHPLRGALCFELFRRAIDYVNECAASRA